jgi:hypothetical protein
MQYMATVSVGEGGDAAARGDKLLLLFQCQQQPGMCQEWSPGAGGNAVLCASADEALPLDPPNGPTFLAPRRLLTLAPFEESDDADTAAQQYQQALAAPGSAVVGKAGGRPVWIQYDETPTCDCRRAMRFIAQLEENATTGLNFGGGSAYVFLCESCECSAKLLWQC